MTVRLEHTVFDSEWEDAPSGGEARMVPYAFFLDPDWYALKVYPRLRYAQAAKRFQEAFRRHGLAPNVGPIFRVRVLRRGQKPLIRYGYATGQVRPFDEDQDIKGWAFEFLQKRLEEAGLKYSDLHYGNVGWWRDSLVPIDFGDASK